MGVKDKIEIIVRITVPSISDVHETISSILEQSNLSSFDVSVCFINEVGLDFQIEQTRLSEHHIHIIDTISDTRFSIPANLQI